MPREKINHPDSYLHKKPVPGEPIPEIKVWDGAPLNEGDTISTDIGLSYHWSKGPDGLAQISVEIDVQQLRNLVKAIDAGDWVGESDLPDRVRIYTHVLSRWDLQRLIKYGRKVRDDVHGADE